MRTDRGGAFVAYTKDGDFDRALEAELVDHIVGRSYSELTLLPDSETTLETG